MEALNMDADLGIVRDFVQEGLEMLDQIEPGLVALSGPSPEPANGPDFVHQVFRTFHSMKGSAGFMNLAAIQRLTHESETLLDRARSGKAPLTGARIQLVLRTCDLLRGILERVGVEGHDRFAQNEVEALVVELHADSAVADSPAKGGAPAAKLVPAAGAGATAADPRQSARTALTEIEALLKRTSGAAPEALARSELGAALRALGADCEAASLPELGHLAARLAALAVSPSEDGPGLISGVLEVFAQALEDESAAALGLDPLLDLIEDALATAGVAEPAAADSAASPSVPAAAPTIPVAGPRAVMAPSPPAQPEGAPAAPAAALPANAARSGVSSTVSQARSSIRVDSERLDVLVDLVGELIIAQSMLERFGAPASSEGEGYEAATAQLSKITRDLQNLSLSLRMVPVATLFQKMTRLVRDMAVKLGKDAELILQGQDTEVDKSVIEQLSDPIVHMLRNALDHGLEYGEERKQAGKPPRGRILLQARQEGDEVRITIRDDGRGLDPDRLLRKGIERGLVRGDGSGLSREEIFRLIFEPGFSTAAAVTDVSGRGVGMDVVKRNVEKLKGRIDVSSVLGQGTAFTIRLPLTLAIIEGMRVRVGESQYAIPMAAIREAVRVAPDAVTRTVEGQELALIRASLYPILRLHEAHRIAPDHAEPWEGLLVLLEHQDRPFALLVDELLGHQQTVVKGLCAYLGQVPGVSGCSILGDGNVSLILDVGELAGRARSGAFPS